MQSNGAAVDTVILNRKARFDYHLFDKYEAGISLIGAEVKSIREGKANLKDSYVRIMKGEAFLFNCHISPYSRIQGYQDLDPIRIRKLLLNKAELEKLSGQSQKQGHAIVPLSLYFKNGRIKVEIALAQGKKQHDKRETIKRKLHEKESNAAIKKFTKRG